MDWSRHSTGFIERRLPPPSYALASSALGLTLILPTKPELRLLHRLARLLLRHRSRRRGLNAPDSTAPRRVFGVPADWEADAVGPLSHCCQKNEGGPPRGASAAITRTRECRGSMSVLHRGV